MEVELPVVDNSECKQKYSIFNIDIDDTQLCAGTKGVDGCNVLSKIFIICNVHF